jgi:hypothetical protein
MRLALSCPEFAGGTEKPQAPSGAWGVLLPAAGNFTPFRAEYELLSVEDDRDAGDSTDICDVRRRLNVQNQ